MLSSGILAEEVRFPIEKLSLERVQDILFVYRVIQRLLLIFSLTFDSCLSNEWIRIVNSLGKRSTVFGYICLAKRVRTRTTANHNKGGVGSFEKGGVLI